MKRHICIYMVLFGLVFAGCNAENTSNTEEKNPASDSNFKPKPADSGTKISASSLAALQDEINKTGSGAVLDLSECDIGDSGTLTINKSLTLRSLDNNSFDINVTGSDVTLTGSSLQSVTAQGSGCNGLKIAGSSLSSLTLGGTSRSRGADTVVPKAALINSSASDLRFSASVELDIAGYGLNVANITVDDGVSVTVNTTSSAKTELEAMNVNGLTVNASISDDDMNEYMNEYGTLGNVWLYSREFPSNAVKYINKLISSQVDNTPAIPIPECGDSENGFVYYWRGWSPIEDYFGPLAQFCTSEFSIGFNVSMAGINGYNAGSYREKISKSFTKFDETVFVFTNAQDLLNVMIEMSSSENTTDADYGKVIEVLSKWLSDPVYYIAVDINEDNQIYYGCGKFKIDQTKLEEFASNGSA